MGVYPLDRSAPRAKKVWTKAELDYLEDKWGRLSVKSIAKKLGRSEASILNKVHRAGLGRALLNTELISFATFSEVLTGQNSNTYLKNRMLKAGFPFKKKNFRGKQQHLMIDIDDFWEFAEQRKEFFDFAKLQPNGFGYEPEWATIKRKADARRYYEKHPHNAPWTKADDRRLERMVETGTYTYSQLAEEFRRSEGAIKTRLYDLGITKVPLKAKRRSWTEEEEAVIIEGRIKGLGFDDIAKQLGRSEMATRGKCERMLNPEYMKRYHRGRGGQYVGINELNPKNIETYRQEIKQRSGAEFIEIQGG